MRFLHSPVIVITKEMGKLFFIVALLYGFSLSLPNFSLAGAIDVLTLGKYPRLPTCIRDNIVPMPPLSHEENVIVCRQLEHIIQQRLAISHLPQQFLKNMKIGKC